MKTIASIMLMVCAISIQAQTSVQLKTQLDELLPKIKEQQQKVKAADKAYARAKVPRIKTGNDREKVGWYYTGDPQAVFPMSEYDNRQKGRGYDVRIKYKVDTPAELAAAVKEAKQKLDAEKKILTELHAQLKKLREALKAASK